MLPRDVAAVQKQCLAVRHGPTVRVCLALQCSCAMLSLPKFGQDRRLSTCTFGTQFLSYTCLTMALPLIGSCLSSLSSPLGSPGVISALDRDIRSQLGTTIPGGIQTGEVKRLRPIRMHHCAVPVLQEQRQAQLGSACGTTVSTPLHCLPRPPHARHHLPLSVLHLPTVYTN